ncbi:fimbrial protein [Burkholderia ubonensis]|uniref:Fimbrial-type adhesion domain-containing protein n=1 Tax=Burkholderia ubonensis TaxID=101571 RepID=A0AAW3MKA5_9BURK|nr:fimbrial protein [Burkholderia ubonensis]KVK98960.1 hypothetical protein WJ45_15885 [Burkholderia ubonensis]KVO39530.1 hypothetical protein WJ75_08440 [Burkholderia ubonensis]KVP89370.1 hypothetical protein WJ96_20480 [Burkholderia ubonensis]KVQ54156.1 hypothetical protein WK04_02630 [Burkholderia ubonensis]KWD49496.1 hypothetical protein WL66_20060 [Burkholderia ubonensis]
MNKVSKAAVFSLLFALGLPLAEPIAAHASGDTGTIRFTGEIRANTCTLASKDVQVDLGDVNADDYRRAGTLRSAKPFTIDLVGCSAELQGVRVKFEGTPDPTQPNYLAVGTGKSADATGMAIELFDGAGHTVGINSSTVEQPLHAGNNALLFMAGYVSTTDKVKAGNANAVAEFTLQYR